MHLIYLDLLTTVLFFGFIGYLERFGMIGKNKVSPILIQKVNQLIYHNLWLYVLPYFYSITLMSDLENFFGLTYYANQIWYFLLILLVQMVVFMKIQPVGTLVYFLKLRDIWQKIFSKNIRDEHYWTNRYNKLRMRGLR